MESQRIILHVDLNSFFATAEQQANPKLRGKPVGIIKATGRTCLIATSVEAKKLGIKTGMSVHEAKKNYAKIILVPADFDKYEDITFRFINICKTYSPVCEVFSLDECFIDITESERLFGGFLNIAFEIKERLRSEVGEWMSCSIGISHNRLLAKLGGSLVKYDGLIYIDKKSVFEVLDKCELTGVLGLGHGLGRHLGTLGIDNFPKLRNCPLPYLISNFGPFWGPHLYNLARGIDGSPVNSFHSLADAKSVGRTYTTHRNLYKKEEIERLIRNLCEEAAAKARRMKMAGRYVGIALRGAENHFWRHITLKHYLDDGRDLFDICLRLTETWRGEYVRFCGITLSMLTKKEYLPTPLLSSDLRREKLIDAMDKVNLVWGDYAVYPAQLLGTNIIRPEVNGYFGDKTFRLNFLRSSG
ncbi:hypothetical protein HY382_01795 [Candidatus Curtissbacteria bacterium]|nr:hypothetical protein [Candidatus Curtissbacteria bacterium]